MNRDVSLPPLAERLASLTEREREILGLIGRGLSLPEIADQLHRSQKTIQTHRLALGRKLGVSNRVELARIAYMAGLAPLNEGADPAGPVAPAVERPRDHLPHTGPAWQALQRIDAVIAASSGPGYFRELPMALVRALGVKGAGISELIQNDQAMRCVTWCQDGQLQDEFIYPLAGTPCHTTLLEGATAIEEHLQQRYPDDTYLAEQGITAYMGVRLAVQDQAIGVLWLTHDGPIDRSTEPLTILKICASRAAAELRRQRDVEALREMAEAAEASPDLQPPRKATLRRRTGERPETSLPGGFPGEHPAGLPGVSLPGVGLPGAGVGLPGVGFETIIEALPEGVAVLDAEGRIRYANPCFVEMLGREPAHLLGRSPADFMTEPEAARFLEMTPKRRIGTLGRYRTTFRRADHTLIDALVSSKPAYDEAGQYLGAFAILSTI